MEEQFAVQLYSRTAFHIQTAACCHVTFFLEVPASLNLRGLPAFGIDQSKNPAARSIVCHHPLHHLAMAASCHGPQVCVWIGFGRKTVNYCPNASHPVI